MCPDKKLLHDFRLYQPAVQQAGAVFPDVSKNGSGAEQKLLLGKGVQYPFGGGGGFVFGDDFIANGGITEGQLPSLNATFEKVVKRISELIYEYWT